MTSRPPNPLIRPDDLIARLGVEGLCRTAEEYFRKIEAPRFLLDRPFDDVAAAPDRLCRMGLMLSGLRLAAGMTVLDFGAGSCWFSRVLNQFGCATVSVDPSPTALEIGRKLFAQQPPSAPIPQAPRFLPFDGRRIDLGDESVDRVMCFDAFHHVPNPAEVLGEFFRVLKSGGIAGFSEPGRGHWKAPLSQHEMRQYGVLERDIDLVEVRRTATRIGFGHMYCKIPSVPALDFDVIAYRSLARKWWMFWRVRSYLNSVMTQAAIFFLVKGRYRPDSRTPEGLAHTIRLAVREAWFPAGQSVSIPLTVANAGTALWLSQTPGRIGAVHLGGRLFDAQGRPVNVRVPRVTLPRDVPPGGEAALNMPVRIDAPGEYRLVLDMVSERVCWFEASGSMPQSVTLHVE